MAMISASGVEARLLLENRLHRTLKAWTAVLELREEIGMVREKVRKKVDHAVLLEQKFCIAVQLSSWNVRYFPKCNSGKDH